MRALLFIALGASAATGHFFVDEALRAGLKDVFVCGGEHQKNYIVETLGTGVAFLDFDNDGLLDIFAVTASKLDGFGSATKPVNRLYRNKGNRTFEDVSKKAGVAKAGWGQGVCTGDIDSDGFVDLYVTYWGADVMYRNRGDGTFDDVTPPGIGSRWGTGCAFVDYDRDGKLDLMVANYVDFDLKNTPRPDGPKPCEWKTQKVMCGPQGLKPGLNRLWHNDSTPGKIRFVDVSRRPGDYRQRRILYLNGGAGKFSDVSTEAGAAVMEKTSARGLAVGDYDNDGRLDLLISNRNERLSLLHNPAAAGKSITLRLVGQRANRNGIGAVARVTTGERTLTGEVRSGSTFMSQSGFRLQFGLGVASAADAVEVQWLGGAIEKLGELPAGQIVTITEGRGVTGNMPYAK